MIEVEAQANVEEDKEVVDAKIPTKVEQDQESYESNKSTHGRGNP